MAEKEVCLGCGRSFVRLQSHQNGKRSRCPGPPKSPEEQRQDRVQAEYEAILTAAIIKNGSLIGKDASIFGWATMDDYDTGPRGGWAGATRHSVTCGIASTGRVEEDATWYEFAGTFATSDHYKHGMEVHGVTCNCGKIQDRVYRWDAPVGEAIRIVMLELVEKNVDEGA